MVKQLDEGALSKYCFKVISGFREAGELVRKDNTVSMREDEDPLRSLLGSAEAESDLEFVTDLSMAREDGCLYSPFIILNTYLRGYSQRRIERVLQECNLRESSKEI